MYFYDNSLTVWASQCSIWEFLKKFPWLVIESWLWNFLTHWGCLCCSAFIQGHQHARKTLILWISKWIEECHSWWWPLRQLCLDERWPLWLQAAGMHVFRVVKRGLGPGVEVWTAVCVVEARGPPTYKLMVFCKDPRSSPFPVEHTLSHIAQRNTPQSGQWDAWRDTAITSVFKLLSQHRKAWGQPLTHVSLCSLSVGCFLRWWWVLFCVFTTNT